MNVSSNHFMKFLAIPLLILLIFVRCENDESEPDTRTTVDLIASDDPGYFQKPVILFENHAYIIKTNYDTFVETYASLDVSGFEQIKSRIEADMLTSDTLKANDYYPNAANADYVLAQHLEEGTCLVYDKETQSIVSTIKFERYSYGGALAGGGGRKFYINGELFLTTLDWIS